MGVLQVSLEQVISEFKESFHSVDIRAAARKSDSEWESVLMGIRVSSRSVEFVQQRYAELERKFGGRATESFKILLEALPFSKIDSVIKQICQGRVAVGGESVLCGETWTDGSVTKSRRRTLGETKGRVERYQNFVRPWDSELWPGMYFSMGAKSQVFSAPQIMSGIRTKLGWNSIEEIVSNFLEVKELQTRSLDLFFHVEMPAKIERVIVESSTARVTVMAEKSLQGIHLFVSCEDSNGVTKEKIEVPLERTQEKPIYVILEGQAKLDSMAKARSTSCVLTHENGFELDEVSGLTRQFVAASEKNPLLECLKQFWNAKELYQQIERPHETRPKKHTEGPQDVFQRSVAVLLNLAGFQAIDLGRNDVLRHQETKVARATLDILAYQATSKLLILGACILNTPKDEDLDKLLHAKEVLSKLFPSGSSVKLVPVIFSSQENDPRLAGGIKIVNAGGLRKLRGLIEEGEEDRFFSVFYSP